MEIKELMEIIDKFNKDRDWEQYHSPSNLSKSICIEACELLECFQWNNDNYNLEDVKEELNDEIYKDWYDEAPFFIKNQVLELRNFIKKYITKKSTDRQLLYKIDNGRIRPSKALQDCIVSLKKGNKEFMLLDEQAVVYDMCNKTMKQCLKDLKKRTIVIQGGPGTLFSNIFFNEIM